ncbi:MAG: hypothetical protein PHY99_10610 [Bacteroidales bacterium]|nr:hypothetical protein [Bacteroidales bacterium]
MNLLPWAVSEVNLSFRTHSSGWQTGSVQVSDFPMVFDNELQFSFRTESNIPVLLLSEAAENRYLKSAYGNDPNFKLESFGVKGFPRSDFKEYNLVILSGIRNIDTRTSSRIRDYLLSGGTVWFLPELSGDLNNYNDFLKTSGLPELQNLIPYRVESKTGSAQNEWLQEVVVNIGKHLRLPWFEPSWRISPVSPDRTDLLNSLSGDVLLSQFRVGNGSFVLSAFPLDDQVTDFIYHPLFIPICYRIATMSKRTTELYQVNGSEKPVTVFRNINQDQSVIRLKNNKSSFETVPVQHDQTGSETVLFTQNLTLPGQYLAITGNDTVARIAFNRTRAESNLKYLADSVIHKRFINAGWNISVNNNSLSTTNSKEMVSQIAAINVWIYFMIIALASFLAESFVMNKKK